MDTTDTTAGQAVYSPWVLRAYDLYVLGLSNRFAWRCPTSNIVRMYDRLVSDRHLDVGVGSGYYLDHCRFPSTTPRIDLLDLNANSLAYTARRIARYQPTAHQADILAPLPSSVTDQRFGSIALMYVLHCLPGRMADKRRALSSLAPLLEPGGVVFGATLLGADTPHNALARKLRAVYNAKGIFGNLHDSRDELKAALDHGFRRVEIEVIGCVALFLAREPRDADATS